MAARGEKQGPGRGSRTWTPYEESTVRQDPASVEAEGREATPLVQLAIMAAILRQANEARLTATEACALHAILTETVRWGRSIWTPWSFSITKHLSPAAGGIDRAELSRALRSLHTKGFIHHTPGSPKATSKGHRQTRTSARLCIPEGWESGLDVAVIPFREASEPHTPEACEVHTPEACEPHTPEACEVHYPISGSSPLESSHLESQRAGGCGHQGENLTLGNARESDTTPSMPSPSEAEDDDKHDSSPASSAALVVESGEGAMTKALVAIEGVVVGEEPVEDEQRIAPLPVTRRVGAVTGKEAVTKFLAVTGLPLSTGDQRTLARSLDEVAGSVTPRELLLGLGYWHDYRGGRWPGDASERVTHAMAYDHGCLIDPVNGMTPADAVREGRCRARVAALRDGLNRAEREAMDSDWMLSLNGYHLDWPVPNNVRGVISAPAAAEPDPFSRSLDEWHTAMTGRPLNPARAAAAMQRLDAAITEGRV